MKAVLITIVVITVLAVVGSDVLIALMRAAGIITGNGILG